MSHSTHPSLLKRHSLCRVLPVFCLFCFFFSHPSAVAQPVPTIHFIDAAVIGHHIGHLSWNRLDSASSYQLFRCYPDQTAFTHIATLTDTHYTDTLHRVVCADTVSYCVTALLLDTLLRSDTAGLYYQDNIPTAPCTLRLCTVDTLLNRVRLSWEPSPDTDVMGYYICKGSPCLEYDTVWGRLNTEYLCREDLTLDEYAHTEFSFRILAFDSCFQASPLTPYYHNPVLNISAEPCSRRLHFSWNRYINMPDSVNNYYLNYFLNGDDTHHYYFTVGSDGSFAYDLDIPDLAVRQIYAYLVVYSNNDSLVALSRVYTFRFDQVDTARYANILSANYLDTVPAVHLDFEVDPDFQGQTCLLMRRVVKENDNYPSPFVQIAQLTRSLTPSPQQFFSYTDTDIQRTAAAYIYRLDVPDLCNQLYVLSDTVGVSLPPQADPAAWIPNIIKGGDPALGRFCPSFVAPLVQDYCFEVYTRWGQRVFLTHTLSECWDGTDFRHNNLPQGVYVYRITCRHTDKTLKTYSGTVTLLR